MKRFISNLIVTALLVGIFVYGYQNGWFIWIQKMFGAVRSDVEYQQKLIHSEDQVEEKDDGVLSVTSTKSRRRTNGFVNYVNNR